MSFAERPVFQITTVADINALKVKSAPSRAAIKALAVNDPRRVHGNEILCDDGSVWKYHSTSTISVTATMTELIMQPDDLAASGRWLRREGSADLALSFTYATTDTTVLLTLPTGCIVRVLGGYWEVSADFTGGTSSAIGLSGPSPHNTKGDLLGGASGDLQAALTAGTMKRATVGADIAAGVMLNAGETVKFDRIASAFTAGSGVAHLQVQIIKNAGA